MTNCIFWIATKEYEHELKQSVESVARCMPDTPLVLLSPDLFNMPIDVDQTVLLEPRKHHLWYLDFVWYMNEAINQLNFERLLYLDVDTYMIHPVPEIFDMLDRFDITSTIAPGRVISPLSISIPDAFAEFNTGVLAFRNTDDMRHTFDYWYDIYQLYQEMFGENDQAPLRQALWQNNDIQVGTLPFEYNCRFGFGGQATGLVKILHGRSSNMAKLAQDINSDTGIRGWRRGDYS